MSNDSTNHPTESSRKRSDSQHATESNDPSDSVPLPDEFDGPAAALSDDPPDPDGPSTGPSQHEDFLQSAGQPDTRYEEPPVGPDLTDIDPGSVDAPWSEYLSFTPYHQQIHGIDLAVKSIADEGYLTLEGACGTGKTLIALVAALHIIRDRPVVASEYETSPPRRSRVLAVTPVKQQLEQFVSEARQINRHLDSVDPLGTAMDPSPVPGVVFRGKGDMVPLLRFDVLPMGDAGPSSD